VAYLPALGAQFINWDDPAYVTQNRNARDLSWATVRWAFTTFHTANWHPLTWLSLALDHTLWGVDPRGFHATSVVLHAANTGLVLLVLHRLTGAFWRSVAVAALFGLHPLHVESVAWVAERKDVLSALFWLLTMLAYVRWARRPGIASYALVAGGLVCALLAKPMAITLPFVLLLLDWWPLRRLSRRAVLEKLPLVLLALGQAAATFLAQRAGGAVGIDPIPIPARIANAVVAHARYLVLTVWPHPLSPWYSHPALEGPPLSAWTIAAAAALLLAITAAVLAGARRWPWAAVGWLWWLGTLVPVIGLVQVGRQAMADRYTYLPHVGLFLALVWTAAELPIWSGARRRAAIASVGAVLLVLGVLTFRQTRIWHDARTFWTYTVTVNPHSFVAHQALGGILARRGLLDEARAHLLRAARMRPGVAAVRQSLGDLLARQGRIGAAAAQYRKAVLLAPDDADAHRTLAGLLRRLGRPVQAERHLARAAALAAASPKSK
ncbi:MAG TPA: hypothetical protein VKA21_05010, partial [Candidatus Binatia bacterium]|nr:hypothetical protein [Candidatus Binatia bacterium]